jgi:hypothetical protein
LTANKKLKMSDKVEHEVEVIVFETELLHVGLSIGTVGFDFWFPETKQQAKVNQFTISSNNQGRGIIKEKKKIGNFKSNIESIQDDLLNIQMLQYDLINNNCHNYVLKAMDLACKHETFERVMEYEEIVKFLNDLY